MKAEGCSVLMKLWHLVVSFGSPHCPSYIKRDTINSQYYHVLWFWLWFYTGFRYECWLCLKMDSHHDFSLDIQFRGASVFVTRCFHIVGGANGDQCLERECSVCLNSPPLQPLLFVIYIYYILFSFAFTIRTFPSQNNTTTNQTQSNTHYVYDKQDNRQTSKAEILDGK